MWNAFYVLLLLVFSQVELISSKIILETSTVDFGAELKGQYGKDGECKVSLNKDLNLKQPLFLVPGTEKYLNPIANTTDLLFRKCEHVELYCTSGFTDSKVKSIVTSCDGDNGFLHDGEIYNISQLSCKGPAYHVATRTAERCFNDATLVKIGFNVGSRFLKMYEVCFDENSLASYYVKHHLSPFNAKHQSTKRPQFIQGDFYPELKVSKLYSLESQRKTLGTILGSADRANELLNNKKDLFLARGHLAAKADFVFGSHQRATFWFLNVAPQWQKFNAFNWQRVESGVKDFVARRNLNVTVYTGTYGVSELLDANGDMQKLYLDFDPNQGGRIPVPKIYYKIVHDELNDAGIVLIGVNNPHVTMDDIRENYIFCDDVADQIDWLNWKRDYIPGGYSYACDVNEFNAVTKHLSLGKITSLLV